MLNASGSLTRPETSQAKNGWVIPAERSSIPSSGRATPNQSGAFAHQPSRTCYRAVTVSIRLHHRHHARHRTDALLDPFEVCGKVIEIDLSPGRTPGENVFLIFEEDMRISLQRNVLNCPQPRLKGDRSSYMTTKNSSKDGKESRVFLEQQAQFDAEWMET